MKFYVRRNTGIELFLCKVVVKKYSISCVIIWLPRGTKKEGVAVDENNKEFIEDDSMAGGTSYSWSY